MGSLYKRGRLFWISYYKNGRRFCESTHTDKVKVAENILKRREGSVAEGKMPGSFYDRVRFEELVEDLLNDYTVNGKRSAAKTAQRVRVHLDPYFGGMRVSQITTATVNAYIARRLDEGAGNATINRELAALKRALNIAARGGKISRDNVPYIGMLTEPPPRSGFFEHEQFLTLRDGLPKHLRGFVTFGYKTGCRFGEICGLKWEGVNRKEKIVRLEGAETKNKEARWIPLDVELQAVISEQARARRLGCDYVFHVDGLPVKDIRGAWKAACKAAGCEGMLFHDLRRSAVRNMVRAGIPEQVAMRISGHKTRSIFQRYNIIDDSDLKRAALQQEAYLDGK